MCRIGTASSGLPGYNPVHIARDTSPCSDDTALALLESFNPSTVMQNSSLWLWGFSRPRAMSLSWESPSESRRGPRCSSMRPRSEEHTSELQSHLNLVCRLLLEKKKKRHIDQNHRKKQKHKKTTR